MIITETKSVMRSAHLLGQALLLIWGGLMSAIIVVLVWLVIDLPQVGQALATSVGYGGDALRSWQGFALATILLIQIGIWIAAVWRGRQIFTALTTGALGNASIAASKTAKLLWFMLIWSIVGHMLGTVVATWHFTDGTRALGISLGSAEISTAFAALLATFTSRAFVLGAALWQDHKEVI